MFFLRKNNVKQAYVANYQNSSHNNSLILKPRGIISRREFSEGNNHFVNFAPVSDLKKDTGGYRGQEKYVLCQLNTWLWLRETGGILAHPCVHPKPSMVGCGTEGEKNRFNPYNPYMIERETLS